MHTAILSIASIPRNATVFVDDKQLDDTTPSIIKTILPGEHEVRLEKNGYLAWIQNLRFKSNEVTSMDDVILFQDERPVQIQPINAVMASVSPMFDGIVYITKSNSWFEMWSMAGTQNSIKLLLRLPYDESDEYSISWSANGTFVLFTRDAGDEKDIYITRLSDGYGIKLPEQIIKIEQTWWDQGDDLRLYVKSDNRLGFISLSDGSYTQLDFESDCVRAFQNRFLALTNSHDRTALSFQENETASIITYLPIGKYEFTPAGESLIGLFDVSRNQLILIDPNNREQPILLNENAKLWSWNPQKDTLLYTSGYDLKSYAPKEHSTKTLTRQSEQIQSLAWYPRGSVAIYQTSEKIIALRIENLPLLSQVELTSGLSGLFWFGDNGDNLFQIDKKGGSQGIYLRPLQ